MRHTTIRRLCERGLGWMIGRGRDREKFLAVAYLLAREGRLPISYRPHKLSGEWAGYWECHIESDWLLIYQITETAIILARTGTHADLFE